MYLLSLVIKRTLIKMVSLINAATTFSMVLGLLSKLYCIWYIWKRLKVSIHIIRILLMSVSISIMLQSVGLFGQIWLHIWEIRSILQCSLLILPYPINSVNFALMSLLISLTRFHMANRTRNNLRHSGLFCLFTL